MSFQIYVKSEHIIGKLNAKPDLLSRFCMTEFRTHFPNMDKKPQSSPKLWLPTLKQSEMFSPDNK